MPFVFLCRVFILQHCFNSGVLIETRTTWSCALKLNEKMEEQGGCRRLGELQMVTAEEQALVSQPGRAQG